MTSGAGQPATPTPRTKHVRTGTVEVAPGHDQHKSSLHQRLGRARRGSRVEAMRAADGTVDGHEEERQMSGQAILVVGGYDVVGCRIAADLAPDYPDRVVVAGRNPERANAMAAGIGHGVRGRALDVTVPSSIVAALNDIGVVVSCIDQPERGLLHAAIQRGLCYTDITPHLVELGRGAAYGHIDAAARASGSLVLLGAGLVPGISNVMVRAVAGTLGGVDTIETALLLAASDVSGPASFDYFLQELAMPFDVHVDGADRAAHAFSDPRMVEFPAPVGPRRAYVLPFSDQVLYPRTLRARTARSRLALDPAWLARVLAGVVRAGVARIVAQERVRRAVARARRDRASRQDAPFALRVDVRCGARSSQATLVGRVQADATAAGAAGLVRALVDEEVAEPGAWMPEQVIDPPRFFAYLAQQGFSVRLGDA
jgi:saccharopine dehydrogenase (NAD+, L-lysine-forming)